MKGNFFLNQVKENKLKKEKENSRERLVNWIDKD